MPAYDPSKKKLVDRVLKEPELFPDEFKEFIRQQIASPTVVFAQAQLPRIKGGGVEWNEGAVPPVEPGVGDLWLLHPATGIDWLFRYEPDQDATYPWIFVGGAAMYHGVSADESTASSTFTNLATDGPTLTMPRAGVMDIDFSANGYLPSGGTPPNALVTSISIGGGVPTDVDGIHWGWTVVNLAQHGSRELRKTVAANDVVKMQYRSANASIGQWRYRELRVIPVRIA